MTPIPADVAAAIVAAGHSLSAEPGAASGYGRAVWEWHHGASLTPRWSVSVGSLGYRGTRGVANEETTRAALLRALGSLASALDHAETASRAEWKRLRRPDSKAAALADANSCAKRAADVRALAAQVAAMWPEVTP